jgi:hypothetical protein
MNAVTDEQALEALRTLRAYFTPAPGNAQERTFTQHDRPVWATTKGAYLRAWRALRAEGHTGVTQAGKLRLMTATAADTWVRRQNGRRRQLRVVPAAPRDAAAGFRAALNLRSQP